MGDIKKVTKAYVKNIERHRIDTKLCQITRSNLHVASIRRENTMDITSIINKNFPYIRSKQILL